MPVMENTKPASAFDGVFGHLRSAIQDVESEIQRLGEVRESLMRSLELARNAHGDFVKNAQALSSALVISVPPVPAFAQPEPIKPAVPSQPPFAKPSPPLDGKTVAQVDADIAAALKS